MNRWQNWSQNQQCTPEQVLRPRSESELADILRASKSEVRVVGEGHSFSALVPTDGTIISLDQMTGVIDTDNESQLANCWAGTPLRELGPLLWEAGLSLPVQGDVDPQSIGGAVGTGTHGTGRAFGSLSSLVVGFRLMLADGSILDCDAEHHADVFSGGRVGLGALGIMTRIRLQCVPAFRLQHKVWTMLREESLDQFDRLLNEHRHFEIFEFIHSDRVVAKTLDVTDDTTTRPNASHDDLGVWLMCESARCAPPLGRLVQRLGLRYFPDEFFTDRAYLIYPSDRNVRFNEVEYAVPAEQFEACERELMQCVRSRKINEGFPFEYRWVQADDIWLSPFYQRDSAVFSAHRYHKQSHVELFEQVESVFQKYDGRPHWGKLHSLKHDKLQTLYPRWDDFCDLRRRLDPHGRFLNTHLRNVFNA